MAYDPGDMLVLANYLLRTPVPAGQDESRWRAAIGRCYYACLLRARDQLWGIDGWPTGGQKGRLPKGPKGRDLGTHEQIIEALGVNRAGPSPAKGIRLRNSLLSLKALRTAADYRHSDSHPDVQKLFNQYSVSTWSELAEQALILSSQTLPELSTVKKFA